MKPAAETSSRRSGRGIPRPRSLHALRGFTIIEVLIAIVLVVLLGGIIFSTAGNAADESAFAESLVQLEQSGTLARAEAAREQSILVLEAVWTDEGSWRLRCREAQPDETGAMSLQEAAPSNRGVDRSASSGREGGENARMIVLGELPRGLEIAPYRDSSDESSDEPSSGDADEQGDRAPVMLGLFLPNGRATGPMIAVHGRGGRLAVGRVQGLGGKLVLERREIEDDSERSKEKEPKDARDSESDADESPKAADEAAASNQKPSAESRPSSERGAEESSDPASETDGDATGSDDADEETKEPKQSAAAQTGYRLIVAEYSLNRSRSVAC